MFVEGSDDIMEYWCSSEWGTVGLSETSLPEETQYRSAELVAVLASASGEIPRSFENQSLQKIFWGEGQSLLKFLWTFSRESQDGQGLLFRSAEWTPLIFILLPPSGSGP